jgi:hypothetical protein
MHMALVVGTATVLGRAPVGVRRRHLDFVLIDMVAMHVVQMPIVQEIDMVLVANGRMAASGTMNVCMIAMLRIAASGHALSPDDC